ncbi:chondroitinase-B domain-containing protein [Cryobacterium luteum]|uniref:chondroitinase-B domain-containing protein n=1 Tax=Cryobacterium luteum TaxID=1424661 RepID=UPI00141B5FE8|nr:chondroitinase-B domain-containing protein [Cryobacterium luteum]
MTPELNRSTVTVTTSEELTAGLEAVQPGQSIALADGVYTSDQFEAAVDGTASTPITLTGSRDAILTTGAAASGSTSPANTGKCLACPSPTRARASCSMDRITR